MEDVQTIAEQLRDGAQKRGIRIVDASYPGDAAAVLSYETTTVDEVLDIAQQSFTPFISIGVVPFDLDGIELGDDDDEGDAQPEEILELLAEHVGESEGVCMQWLAGGALIIYLAVAPWRRELDRLLEQWAEQRDAERDDDRRSFWARVTFLADQLERDPAYRGANMQQRPSIGKAIIEPLLQAEEGVVLTTYVLRSASSTVRENSAVAYAELTADMDALAAELSSIDAFKYGRLGRDRTAATRDFLIRKSGGYAPTAQLVEDLRRTAERP